MVFPDLSAPQATPHKLNIKKIPLAPVGDRLVALLLDFLIFSPVISLLVAGLMRDARTFFILDSASEAGLVFAGLVFAVGFLLFIILQAVFLYFWQATPGQLFLQMHVISFPNERDRLTLNQCLLRPLFWCLALLALALPFLEILSHPWRRAFHERASDTMVVTLKAVGDDGPMPLEARFVSSWLRMSFLFLFLLVVLGFFKSYHSLKVSGFKRSGAPASYACKEMPSMEASSATRMDTALALFLLNEISPECLNKEAEASLWNDPVQAQDLGYFAKYLTTEGDEQKQYFAKVCEEVTSAPCQMVRYMEEDAGLNEGQLSAPPLTLQVLLAEEKFARADYVGSLKIIEKLQNEPGLKFGLEKRFVRTIWALQKENALDRARSPASADLSKEKDAWIEKFKERYEVP